MLDKLSHLLMSKRFWVAIGGAVFVIFDGMGLGLSADQVNHLVLLGGSWIVGDSLRSVS